MSERQLMAGMLSKEATFRVLVDGRVGAKEIERLIRKLELDKEILAEAEVMRFQACTAVTTGTAGTYV